MIRDIALVFAALLIIASCASHETSNWRRSPGADASRFFSNRVDADRVFPIESLRSVESDLLSRQFVPVSGRRATELLGHESAEALAHKGKHLYLIRAVCNVDGGTLTVYQSRRDVYVFCGGLGKPGPLRRLAVIVASDIPIEDAYASFVAVE